MHPKYEGGWVEVICGPMFCGKSEELIRRIGRVEIAGQKFQVFKHVADDRYATGEVSTHNGRRLPALAVGTARALLERVGEGTEVVAIDEAQFFDSELIAVCDLLAERGLRVIVAGLDMNFRGEPFGPMPQLLARAERVTKLTAVCTVCGGPASFSQRLLNGRPAPPTSPEVMVGGSETYQPRCRRCWKRPGG